MTNDYSDILTLPHPDPRNRTRMTMQARAAQFAPFAALTGHGAAIEETARLTESEVELEVDERELLDRKLAFLMENLQQEPEVTVTYFVPDDRKSGGCYRSTTSIISKLDSFRHMLYMQDGTRISLNNVIDIEGNIFERE